MYTHQYLFSTSKFRPSPVHVAMAIKQLGIAPTFVGVDPRRRGLVYNVPRELTSHECRLAGASHLRPNDTAARA